MEIGQTMPPRVLRGGGTQSNPYLISSAEQFAYMCKYVNNLFSDTQEYFKLTSNINLIDHYWDFNIIFHGGLDGGGCAIKYLNIQDNTSGRRHIGLFSKITGVSSSSPLTTIKNLKIEHSNVHTTNKPAAQYVGVLAGYITDCTDYGSIVIQDCGIDFRRQYDDNLKDTYIGLVSGFTALRHDIQDIDVLDSTIDVCACSSDTTSIHIGGFTGYLSPYLTDSTSSLGRINVDNVTIYERQAGVPQTIIGGGLIGRVQGYSGSYDNISIGVTINLQQYNSISDSNQYINSGFIGLYSDSASTDRLKINNLVINDFRVARLSDMITDTHDIEYLIIGKYGTSNPAIGTTAENINDVYVNTDKISTSKSGLSVVDNDSKGGYITKSFTSPSKTESHYDQNFFEVPWGRLITHNLGHSWLYRKSGSYVLVNNTYTKNYFAEDYVQTEYTIRFIDWNHLIQLKNDYKHKETTLFLFLEEGKTDFIIPDCEPIYANVDFTLCTYPNGYDDSTNGNPPKTDTVLHPGDVITNINQDYCLWGENGYDTVTPMRYKSQTSTIDVVSEVYHKTDNSTLKTTGQKFKKDYSSII